MYCSRPVARSPSVIRIVSPAPHRAASFFPSIAGTSMSPFFGRPAAQDPFHAINRMLEDISSPGFPFAPQHLTRPQAPIFQPRFDVRENDNGNYELRGEIPGVESKDLEVEFSDPQTLIIRGRTERESASSSEAPADAVIASEKGKERITNNTTENVTATAADATDNSDAASTYSTGSYQKPSVEDADATETKEAKDTPATTPGETTADQQVDAQTAEPAQPEEQAPRYFISERSTGSFQRVFKFAHRVDQSAVTASLKNGILNIVVPKAAKPEPRKIQVE